MRQVLVALDLRHSRRRGTAVVPVRDIECGYLLKGALQGIDFGLISDHPDRVGDLIVGYKIHVGFSGTDVVYNLIYCGACAIRHEDRSSVGASFEDMASAIILFSLARLLVLFDDACVVLGDARSRHNTCLFAAIHALPVDVERLILVKGQHTVIDHLGKVLASLSVDLIGVEMGAFR